MDHNEIGVARIYLTQDRVQQELLVTVVKCRISGSHSSGYDYRTPHNDET
jgi:hypothetical protein